LKFSNLLTQCFKLWIYGLEKLPEMNEEKFYLKNCLPQCYILERLTDQQRQKLNKLHSSQSHMG
jgi:hypothetical protein